MGKMTKEREFENFDHTMRQLMKVPHSEIKAKLEEEKKEKLLRKRGRTKCTANTATFATTANFANAAAIATNAATATNSLSLGGTSASNYARLDIGNNLTGNKAVTGNVAASGNLSAGGSAAIGGGPPILQHLSRTFNLSVSALGPVSCAPLQILTLTGASDGDSLALGIPNSLFVGSGNSEPPIPEILSRFVFSGKVSSRLR
jgi:hypothetical protein